MTPTGFINGQDELRCYVNSSFQVLFFTIFLRQLIMNIDCDKYIEDLDKSEDYYIRYITQMVILQVIQRIFCGNLIGGRNKFNSDMFFGVTNISTNVRWVNSRNVIKETLCEPRDMLH